MFLCTNDVGCVCVCVCMYWDLVLPRDEVWVEELECLLLGPSFGTYYMQLWVSYLPHLCLSFLIWKMGAKNH